ncbi:MAG: FAD-dependent oxidoreductase [Candidatus Yanofskybacteria bacterium]|nr:FAD-dependent oxidoreductase [Candidatus Yanofskybacteria bacterium]
MKEIKLKNKEQIAEGTMAFFFEKPSDFEFKADQSVDLYLIDPKENDEEGTKRAFSIASAPFEEDLMIATRMRDTAFKRILATMLPGDPINMDGPFGSVTLHNDASKPAVFLTGGIGITMFRSIILQALHDQAPHQLYLFYSNRKPEDASFLEELMSLQKDNFKCIPTMTQIGTSAQNWIGETGYITQEMLSKYVPDLQSPIYYVAGPRRMVSGMYQMLIKAGINSDNIRTEEYDGY